MTQSVDEPTDDLVAEEQKEASRLLYSHNGYPYMHIYIGVVALSLEGGLRLWEIGRSVPRRVKPMAYKNRYLSLHSLSLSISRIGQGLVNTMITRLSGILGLGASSLHSNIKS